MEEDLSQSHVGISHTLLGLGDSTILPIAKRSGVKRTSIYYFIDRLVELGLIDQAKIRGRMHYKARPPEQLVSLQEQRLDEVKKALPQFESLYNVSTKKPRISYFEGPEQMRQIMLEEWKSQTVYWVWPSLKIDEMVGGNEFMQNLVGRDKELGVKFKIVRFRGQDPTWEGARHGEVPGREIRFAPAGLDLPMAIGIFDTGKVGFLTSRKEGFGILIESQELYLAMRVFFDLFWEKSTPAAIGEG